MLCKKLGLKIIIQLSQHDGKLPLPQWKQGNYPVISIYAPLAPSRCIVDSFVPTINSFHPSIFSTPKAVIPPSKQPIKTTMTTLTFKFSKIIRTTLLVRTMFYPRLYPVWDKLSPLKSSTNNLVMSPIYTSKQYLNWKFTPVFPRPFQNSPTLVAPLS